MSGIAIHLVGMLDLEMIGENDEDQLGIDDALEIGEGFAGELGDAEEGFPKFENDLDFPAEAVGGVDHVGGKNFCRDIGDEDGPSKKLIILGGMIGSGLLIVFGFSAAFFGFFAGQRNGDDPQFELVRCAEKEFLIKNAVGLLFEELEKVEKLDGDPIEASDGGVVEDAGDEIDVGGDHLGEDVQREVSQIADDQIALAGDGEDIGGSGLIVAGIRRDGKAGEETGEEIIGELNFEGGGLFLTLIASAREEVDEGRIDGDDGAVDDPDIGEETKKRIDLLGIDLERKSDDDFEEFLEENDGMIGDAFRQCLFGDEASGEGGDDGRDTVHGRGGGERTAAEAIDQSQGGDFAP